jgi:aminotransferase
VWLQLGERAGDGSRFAYDLLEAEGIAVAPGSAFGPGGAGHVRLALAVPPETLGPAAEKLVAFWRTWE